MSTDKPRVTFWKVVLLLILCFGAYAAIVRFAVGLGAATNLTDAFPWGLWIGFDVLVCVALMFDLGMPHRIWHPLIMWNPHSVMFEIGWYVTLYTTVLALEFSPMVLERFNLQTPLKMVRFIYTPLLPVFFFISAIAGGLAMTIFESFLSKRAFGKRLEGDLLRGLGRVIVVVLAVLAVWRLQDLAARGNFGLIFQLTPESVMFWGEFGLGIALPLVLFAVPWIRRTDSGVILAATLTIMGFIVNRLNVAITGMSASSGVTYVPSWMELAVTMSIVAAGFALFGLAVRYLAVFPEKELEAGESEQPAGQPRAVGPPIFRRRVLVTLWSLLFLGAVWIRKPRLVVPATRRCSASTPQGRHTRES